MDQKHLTQILQVLQKLLGLHRQMLDTVRMEREALVQADLKGIQDATLAKQALIEGVHAAEADRLRQLGELALIWRRPVAELTISQIAIEIQVRDPKLAEQFRSAYNALKILIERITEQNEDNRVFVDKALVHIGEMKNNVLGESIPKSNTYTQQGQRANAIGGARLISKEA